jgi:serine/threonine protein kinase
MKRLLATSDPDAAERFRREVRLLSSSLDHPNIVKVVATQVTG